MAFGQSGGGFGGSSGFGGQSNNDISIDQLLALARARGGNVGEIADELTHHNRGILSTVGSAFKNTFKGFIDVISVPSEIIAGVISPNLTVEEAIKEHKRVSDVIFGDGSIDFNGDGNVTTMEKIGNFIVRLPVDVLTDPLTYLTFGASSAKGLVGALGMRSLPKVSVGAEAAATFGKSLDVGETVVKSLSDKGAEVLNFAKKYERQAKGLIGAEEAKAFGQNLAKEKSSLISRGILTKEEADLTQRELKALVKETVEAPLDVDNAKITISRILEHSPQLAGTLLDKGGIKFFGKSILSAQRISSVVEAVPPLTWIDNITYPIRSSVSALFDPAMIKVSGKYVRLPEEYVALRQQVKDIGASMQTDMLGKLSSVQKAFNPTEQEIRTVMDALSMRKMPADSRLAGMYKEMLGIQEGQLEILRQSGVPISKLDNYTGLIFLPQDTRKVKYNSRFAAEPAASKFAQNAKFIPQMENDIGKQFPQLAEEIKKLLPDGVSDTVTAMKSMQEVGFEIGKQIDEITKNLTKSGKTLEEALSDETIKNLQALRDKVDEMSPNNEIVGHAKKLGLKEAEEYGFFVDNEDRIYKRVGASATELERAGITGFDTNLLTAYTARGMKNISQALGHNFMSDLVRNFGRVADEAPDSWVSISSAAIDQKALEISKGLVTDSSEIVFHPAIAKDFEKMMTFLDKGDEVTSDFLKQYDRLQKYWKASVTSIFPQFHGRNAISNVLLNMMDLGTQVLNPKTNFTAMDMIVKDRKINGLMTKALAVGEEGVKAKDEIARIMGTKMFTDRSGYSWTYGELRSVAKKHGVAFNPNITGSIDLYNDRESLAKFFGIGVTKKDKALKNIKKVVPIDTDQFLLTKGGRAVGTFIEEQARLTNFVANLINTGDVSHAAARTKQFLFDYQNLTNFERNVLRRVIPFYTFTRKNLELQVKTLFSAPGRIAGEVKAIRSLGDLMGAENLTEEEQSLLPPWLKNNFTMKRKKDGKEELISGFGSPIEQPFQQFTSNQLLGSISPLIRYPIEAASGYNFFRGKMTSDVTDAKNYATAPQAVKEFIGYVSYEATRKDGTKYTVHVALRPERMHLIEQLPYTGRTMSTLSKLDNKDVAADMRILQGLTGISAQTIDFDFNRDQQERQLIQDLEELLQNAGIRSEFKKGYTRKNTKALE